MSGTTLYSEIMGGTLTNSRYAYFPDVNVNMMVGQVATSNLTAQTANSGAQVLTSSALAGLYRVSCYTVLTTAGTTSSTLPQCAFQFTDADTGVQSAYLQITGNLSSNIVGTTQTQGFYTFNAKAGTTIQYATLNYASSGATPMAYAIHVRLEYLGQ